MLYEPVPAAMVAGDKAVRAPVKMLREYIETLLPT